MLTLLGLRLFQDSGAVMSAVARKPADRRDSSVAIITVAGFVATIGQVLALRELLVRRELVERRKRLVDVVL